MPERGVSDISNRGPLDRLLLSELAHEDTTLAVRIALNEALYYRRETPPSPPPRTRKLLLDAGVRMWDVPRVFAAAVGLALAASPEKKLETAAFRAHERVLDEVDLRTRDGLVAHLAALETAAHPGEALAEFRAELADDSTAAEGVLITCDEVLADSEFQRELARSEFDLIYIAAVSRTGRSAMPGAFANMPTTAHAGEASMMFRPLTRQAGEFAQANQATPGVSMEAAFH